MFIKFFRRIYNFAFSPDRNFARSLYAILGFVPSNLTLYRLAFSHKSYTNNDYFSNQNNERLEYLGDAVLGTIVAEYLFRKYPGKNEGFLTKMRSKIVKRKTLNYVADQMGLDVFLMHQGMETVSNSMMGNALEAFIGAVYLDVGYTRTKRYVIYRILREFLDVEKLESLDENYKSQLLEWCQKNGKPIAYQVLSKFKFDNRDRFLVAVQVDNEDVATAEDFSKKSAEQLASKKALHLLISSSPERVPE
ncbi:MAG: ribonuclease III [Bacteroidota bacterium]